MDHCLKIPEVIRLIYDGIDSDSAYSMSLVARRFVEPALDIRWQMLPCLMPIIWCLPDDLWAIKRKDDVPSSGSAKFVVRSQHSNCAIEQHPHFAATRSCAEQLHRRISRDTWMFTLEESAQSMAIILTYWSHRKFFKPSRSQQISSLGSCRPPLKDSIPRP